MKQNKEVNEYLENQLKHCGEYTLTDQDKEIIEKTGIKEYIFRKLMSKKFRKWSLPENVQEKVKEQIDYSVKHNEPIKLVLAYGGYKLWRLPTSPEVDWSEFFYMAHHAKYMAPIATAYEPGIQLNFSSGDIAVTSLNNVPREDVDKYDEGMRTLTEAFGKYLPDNLSFKVSRLRDLFKNDEEFLEEGEKLRESSRQSLQGNEKRQNKFKNGGIQNVQLEGGIKDTSKMSDKELEEMRIRSSEIIKTMYATPQISNNKKPGEILLMATNMSLDLPMIVTGGTKYSTAKFWAGLGVLARNKDSFADYIITEKQWEEVKNKEHEEIESDLIPLKNLEKVLVFPGKFEF